MYIQPEQKIIRILIVDDDEDDYLITKDCISQITGVDYRMEVGWCARYEEALTRICKGEWDMYFIDFGLGKRTGLDLIKEAIGNNCEEPIVLLTGKGNRDIDLQAMRAGAVDYLVKSELNPDKLERCIRYGMERHAFLKALKANEHKYRGIFEKSKDCIFVADTSFNVKEANRVCSTVLGYSHEELLQINLKNLLARPGQASDFEAAIREKGVLTDQESVLITRSGDSIQTIISITKETDENGQHYLQGIIHDISWLKKAEKVTLQTEKFKATERLVRMLAHEVRNPLNNILLAAEQLDLTAQHEEKQIFFQIISRNIDRINNIISELMTVSSAAEIKKEKLTLQQLIDESLLAAMDRINLKQIELQKTYPSEEAWIMADGSKLKIAFINIIINAIESMSQAAGILKIRLDRDNETYCIVFSDNGHGIKEEEMNRIFEPFYTSKANGVGLGLASVLNIMQSHGALLDVHSRQNEGTSFVINFEKAAE